MSRSIPAGQDPRSKTLIDNPLKKMMGEPGMAGMGEPELAESASPRNDLQGKKNESNSSFNITQPEVIIDGDRPGMHRIGRVSDNTGWARDDRNFKIVYRPDGHRDLLIKSWTDFVTTVKDADKNNATGPLFHALTSGTGICLLYTSPSPRDLSTSRMPSSA